MKLSEMRQLLDVRGIQLTKSLGQNFLHDGNQLRRIAGAAELTPADRVLEVGPGLGPLTALLLQSGAHVLAIEKDARLVEVLSDRFKTELADGRLRLCHADALDYLREHTDWAGWKLVSNLPYSVGSPILVELAQAERCSQRLVATLQAEVVDRLAAGPGSQAYGLLTVLTGANFQPAGSFRVPRGCFFPEPDVDSACITLVRRSKPILSPALLPPFRDLVKLAFSQRRKMMVKLLKARFDAGRLEAALNQLRLPLTVRAEAVSIEHFARLTELLHPAKP